MPEVNDDLRGVDARLLQRSQGWALRCVCGSGVKSEIYNQCHACWELVHPNDVKPDEGKSPLPDLGWRSTEIAAAPAAASAIEEDAVSLLLPIKRVTRARGSPSDESFLTRARSPRRSPTSQYQSSWPQRGRPPNGSRPPKGFKGVRQRKNVRGFLVEIRPPKWKRTIWLGTYNTESEAAGAYDAGIYYTNKKTKYNFPALEGSFPPLPSQLRLDRADDAEDIKTFVQRQAREAARKVKNIASTDNSTDSDTKSSITAVNATVNTPSSSEESSDRDQGGLIPLDDDWLLNHQFLYVDSSSQLLEDWMAEYQSFPQASFIPSFDMKQEDIPLGSLDATNGTLLQSSF